MSLPPPASKPLSSCSALTTKGSPCAAPPMSGSQYCAMHDPDTAHDVHAAGGRARARPAVLDSTTATAIKLADPRAVPKTLETVARWVATGQLDVRIANAIGMLASTAVRASDSAELANRLAALEAALGKGERHAKR